MNVALFFTYDVSLDDWNNQKIIEREIKLYKQISEEYNIKFKFFTFGDNLDLKFEEILRPIEIIPIYEYSKKFNNKVLNFFNSLMIPFKIKKELRNVDIVKTNQLMGSWIPIIIKILFRKKLIIRTGYNILEFSIKERRGKLKNIFYYLLTQLSLLICDKYIVTSNADKSYLYKNFLFNKNKLIIINNWVIKSKLQENNKRFENKILAVGRLEKQKNYKSMLQYISGTKFELDIIGTGSLKSELRKFALDNEIRANFLGQINFEDLQKLYSDYQYFMMFSDYEGHPKSLIEAMSAGCIPIVKLTKNITDIVNDSNSIIVDEQSKNMDELFKERKMDHKDIKSLSKNAFEFSNNNYSIDIVLDSEVGLYNSLIKRN